MEKTFAADHALVAITTANLPLALLAARQIERARTVYDRSTAAVERLVTQRLPQAVSAMQGQVAVALGIGRRKKAATLAARTEELESVLFRDVLAYAPEQQRLAYQGRALPYFAYDVLGDARGMVRTILRHKGAVLDSLIEDRRVAVSANPAALAQIAVKKQQLARLLFGENVSAEARARTVALARELEEIESGVARRGHALGEIRRALATRVEEVQAALPADTVLAEFIRYSTLTNFRDFVERYAVVLVSPRGEPRLFVLGDATKIDAAVTRYRKSVAGFTDEKALRRALREMHRVIWAPLAVALPAKTRQVILSPDGQLAFVSFATLLDNDDHFIGERFTLRYVASGRDLLHKRVRRK